MHRLRGLLQGVPDAGRSGSGSTERSCSRRCASTAASASGPAQYDAVTAATSSPSDLKRFRYTVAIPSIALYSQFGRDVYPEQVAGALLQVGFDAIYDVSWMCQMVGGAIDTYPVGVRGSLAEDLGDVPGGGPPGDAPLPGPDPAPRADQVAAGADGQARAPQGSRRARACRPRRSASSTSRPCSAIMHSIVGRSAWTSRTSTARSRWPSSTGRCCRRSGRAASTRPRRASTRGASAGRLTGGESAGMRNANSLAVSGVTDVMRVLRLDRGREVPGARLPRGAHLPGRLRRRPAPDRGALRGAPHAAPRPGARHRAERRAASAVEEKVRALFRQHFFDLEDEIHGAQASPPRDRRTSSRRSCSRQEKERLLEPAAAQGLRGLRRPGLRRRSRTDVDCRRGRR